MINLLFPNDANIVSETPVECIKVCLGALCLKVGSLICLALKVPYPD